MIRRPTLDPARPLRLAAALVVAMVVLAAPAAAHITVNPGEATKGGLAKLTFRVPNERPDSGTTRVEVAFPQEHPIANVSVKPQPGWTYTVERDGDTVSRIVWEGGPINPGEFDEFEVSVGPLPEDADRLVFPALQTYAGGEVVRWIEVPAEGEAEPEHPAPVLTLTGGGEDEPAAADEPAVSADDDDDDDGDFAGLAVAGVVLGALGLVTGGAALARTRRSP